MDKDELPWDAGIIYPSTPTTPITADIQASYISAISAGTDNWQDVAKEIDTNSLTVNGVDVGEFMESVNKRLLILQDDFEKHEKYPALKQLYEQYKMMEKLLGANDEV